MSSTIPKKYPHIPFYTDDAYEWVATLITELCRFGTGTNGANVEDRKCSVCGDPMFVNYANPDQKQHCFRCAREKYQSTRQRYWESKKHPCARNCGRLVSQRRKICNPCHLQDARTIRWSKYALRHS